MSTADAPLLPCLKELKWPGHTDTVCHPLWDQESSPYMPWVAFGFDHPHSFEFISTERLAELKTTAQELESKALAALRARPARWEPVDVDANGKTLRILTCAGDFFSAERVLDPAFMQQAQKILKASGLWVGVPRRGLLMAASANQDQDLIAGFGAAVAGQFSRAESALISPMLFGVKDGAIVGIFDAIAKAAVPDGEPRGALGGPEGDDEELDEDDDPNAPFVSAIVSRNDQGSEDVHMVVAGDDADTLAKAIEAGFGTLLKEHAGRKEFSGHIQIVVVAPPPARRHIPKLLEHLKGICSELSRGKERRYRVSLTYETNALESMAGKPAASTWTRPSWLSAKAVISVLAGVALAYYGITRQASVSYPDTITYAGASLSQATKWDRSGTSAAVYVPAGEAIPGASLQVGLMNSTEHATAETLLAWIQAQSQASPTQRYHDAVTGTERCLAGLGGDRPFISLQICKSGQARAACIESDRELDLNTLGSCLNLSGCFDDLCGRKWSEERGDLDRVLTSFLTP